MTTPKPTPEEENSPQAPATETPPNATGFFSRVRQELKPEELVHPSETAEIVIMDENPDEKTRL